MHQLAVIDGTPSERRLRHVGMTAEFGDLAENLVVLHREELGNLGGQHRMAGSSYHDLPTEGKPSADGAGLHRRQP
ncbi:hypothetical protein [Bradyrhizobium archetypum]|uniref:Uncharacterized protein n=1 Tax=Bradyrhizobium archetypum TaxID=2721160 RepID=A0A7Y4HAL8_9BRAD|nr:hypothetical protein [Bradyrhizobium archetypum]NOJ50725.1 hypothetical protein [Bradyrhizobium archetypum]